MWRNKDDNKTRAIILSIYLFTGIPFTIYSTIELSDSVIVLGQTLKIWGIIQVALSNEIKVPLAVIFYQEIENKKEEKMIRL